MSSLYQGGLGQSKDVSAGMSRPKMAPIDRQTAVIVADVSGSMAPHSSALASAVRDLIAILAAKPNNDAFDLVIIAFNGSATVAQQLTRATSASVPDAAFCASGTTNYDAALTKAEQQIDEALARREISQLRPVVVMFSDGAPDATPDFRPAANRVKAKADVVAVAFGGAASASLMDVASGPTFLATASDMQQVRTFFRVLGASMSASRRAGKSLGALGVDLFASRRR